MASLLSISEVNALDGDKFESIFGNVIELCTDAAVKVKTKRPFKDVSYLCDAFHKYLADLTDEEKLVILKMHPDLAGKLAKEGELTLESAGEQRRAGLHDLTEDQKIAMDYCNESISEVNELDEEQFESIFGNVIELCTDAAVKVKTKRPFKDVSDLCNAFNKYLTDLTDEEKLVTLMLLPDLAGKLAKQAELTRESVGEQRRAGLHVLTEDQESALDYSNERYKAMFGFPFIICARENKIQSIMEGLHRRYNNTRELEINTAINEVKKICKLRILDIVKM